MLCGDPGKDLGISCADLHNDIAQIVTQIGITRVLKNTQEV